MRAGADAASGARSRDAFCCPLTLTLPTAPQIVLDEAHRVKGRNTNLAKALNQVRTHCRALLTGYARRRARAHLLVAGDTISSNGRHRAAPPPRSYPLQNHLQEYYTMVDFAHPGILHSRERFKEQFENPILNGANKDSTETEIKLSRNRSFVLTQVLQPYVLRR